MPERLHLHVEGDALNPTEETLLDEFCRTKRALGHDILPREHELGPTRVVWVVKLRDERGFSSRDVPGTHARLTTECPWIDVVLLHDNSTQAEEVYDALTKCKMQEKAYCFEADSNDAARLAKIFAALLAEPECRESQERTEKLLAMEEESH